MTLPAVTPLPRGVRRADYLIDGCEVLHAIDSCGNCIKRVKLTPDVDEECACVWLEGLLEHYDPPRPQLRLLKFPSPPRLARGAFLACIRRHP